MLKLLNGGVAELVARLILDPGVQGSSPGRGLFLCFYRKIFFFLFDYDFSL